MKTQFDNLKANPNHHFESNSNGDKKVIKVFHGQELIAKKIIVKKSIRYFGVSTFEQYIVESDVGNE